MNWSNVRLILGREIRDQLRDRRTLFMIAVLPLLLYPLMGVSFFQLAQFRGEHATSVLVVGGEKLKDIEKLPPLFDKFQRFDVSLFDDDERRAMLLDVKFAGEGPKTAGAPDPVAEGQRAVQQGQYEAMLYFPPDFVERLQRFRNSLTEHSGASRDAAVRERLEVPSPKIFHNSARETSRIAHDRLEAVLRKWTQKIGEQNLLDSQLPPTAASPFDLLGEDVAEAKHRDAAIWSKLLPFVLLIWALTGAFYPAIDLCAGEKERGTLETLLSSPAERSEIVVGKLATVMLFSIATAVLNLLSMGLTGALVISGLQGLRPAADGIAMPPLLSLAWLALALIPMSALFSALCLALAAFARSTKEGQYYLMPLILATLPLMILPMSPGAELDLGNSLIPVSGLLLLLREAIQGNYETAALYLGPVVAVTFVCCLLAVRWAIDQFNSEKVLFRESERLDLGLWMRNVLRERQATPSAAMAIFAGLVLLLIRFFTSFALPMPTAPRDFLTLTAVVQLAFVAAPALLMTVMLTRSPRQTLLLNLPRPSSAVAAVVLALAMNPLVVAAHEGLVKLYPLKLDPRIATLMENAIGQHFALALLVMAVAPALCEELAFRGFILSGLRHMGHRGRAIVLSSLFFGLTHMILQQSIIACFVGVVIGYLAVQTASLLPCVLFHLTHNGLTLFLSQLDKHEHLFTDYPVLSWVFVSTGDGYSYHPAVIAIGGVVAALILLWLRKLPRRMTREELLQEAIDHHSAQPFAG